MYINVQLITIIIAWYVEIEIQFGSLRIKRHEKYKTKKIVIVYIRIYAHGVSVSLNSYQFHLIDSSARLKNHALFSINEILFRLSAKYIYDFVPRADLIL